MGENGTQRTADALARWRVTERQLATAIANRNAAEAAAAAADAARDAAAATAMASHRALEAATMAEGSARATAEAAALTASIADGDRSRTIDALTEAQANEDAARDDYHAAEDRARSS